MYEKIEASRFSYDFWILQHASLKYILQEKYNKFINVTIFDHFIAPNLNTRDSQYAIVALTTSTAALANQQILLAFMVRKK